jgi:hypothetical protein
VVECGDELVTLGEGVSPTWSHLEQPLPYLPGGWAYCQKLSWQSERSGVQAM